MKGLNKVTLIGTVGKEPEVKTLDGGIKVARFSLATNESYKNKEGQKVESTEWHNLVAWRQLAEIIEKYVKKGSNLYVEGKIKTRSYESESGKKYFTDIVIDSMIMLGGNKPSESSDNSARQYTAEQEDEYLNENRKDDLPF